MSVKVKICGNTTPEDALLAEHLGADYLGLIFAESKRHISPEQAKIIIEALPDFRHFVGVFADQSAESVLKIAQPLNLKILQFHGRETAAYCRDFVQNGYDVIKTIKLIDQNSLKGLQAYPVQSFLFEPHVQGVLGGSGKTFNWDILKFQPPLAQRIFLAGGLCTENVRDAISKAHPYAVDVVSGVEDTPGKKNAIKLKAFMTAVRTI